MKARDIDRPRLRGKQTTVPNETWPKGRRCPVCSCFLSIYNPGKRCWLHDTGSEASGPERLIAPVTPLDRTATALVSFGLADQMGIAA